jgi:hypothetical protein
MGFLGSAWTGLVLGLAGFVLSFAFRFAFFLEGKEEREEAEEAELVGARWEVGRGRWHSSKQVMDKQPVKSS